MDEKKYAELEKKVSPKPPLLKNVFFAFLTGGTICLIGQFISLFYMTYFDFTERTASNPTVATMIFLAMLLTVSVYIRKSLNSVVQEAQCQLRGSVMRSCRLPLNISRKAMFSALGAIFLKWLGPSLCSVYFRPSPLHSLKRFL